MTKQSMTLSTITHPYNTMIQRGVLKSTKFLLWLLLLSTPSALAFLPPSSKSFLSPSPSRWHMTANEVDSPSSSFMHTYSHNQNGQEYTLSYRYRPPTPKNNGNGSNNSPILLIHPVGIGLSSWFWERLLDESPTPSSSAVYAPNLIGCGLSEGSDSWDPQTKGMTFPLGWVEGIASLWKQETRPSQSPIQQDSFQNVTAVAQGGLAPVAIQLAARYPEVIGQIVLCSPPTWKEMTTAIPESELERNYAFLQSQPWGSIAFSLLETRWAIRFFSNQFLFANDAPCDEVWLEKTMNECRHDQASRRPVMAFNAGLCQHRSWEEELTSTVTQPTLLLVGTNDKRRRDEYERAMVNCQIVTLPGCNVLPWESPTSVVQAIQAWCG